MIRDLGAQPLIGCGVHVFGNVFIGFEAGLWETDSNTLYIANGPDSGDTLIYGEFDAGVLGIGTISPTETLDVDGTARIRQLGSSEGTPVVADGNGKLWKQSSSKRYKTDVRDLETSGSKVLQLRPVRFKWKTTAAEDVGLIAEEVEEACEDLVIYDSEGRPDAVKYDRVSLYLLAVVKDLKAENESLKEQLRTQEQSVQQKLDVLERTVRLLTKGEGLEL